MRSLPLVRHLQLMRSLPLVRSSYIGAGPLRGPAPSSRLRSRPQDGIRFMIALFIVIPGWKLPRSLGRVGLVILGVVDSSVIPTFGSLDALTAVLAVKNQKLWPYYAAASTLGSLIGAYITYRVSLRAGEQWLEKRIGTKRSRQVHGLLNRWGFAAAFV